MDNKLVSIRFSEYPVENGQAVHATLEVKSKEDGKVIVNSVCHYRGQYWIDFEKFEFFDVYKVGRFGVLERYIQMDLVISIPIGMGLVSVVGHLNDILL